MDVPRIPTLREFSKTDPVFIRKALVLCHLVRFPSFMETAEDLVDRFNLFSGCPELQFIWNRHRQYFSNYGKSPPVGFVESEIREAELEDPSLDGNYIRERLAQWQSEEEEDLSVDFARSILQEYAEQAMRKTLAASAEHASREELETAAGDIQDLLQASPLEKPEAKNPFWVHPNDMLKQTQRMPLGIQWLDQATGGGILPGELVGFVMPSKAGKTTLVWQGTKESVMRRQNTMIFSFEQALKGDLSLRSYVLASDSTRDDWKSNDIYKVAPDVRKRFLEARSLWAQHLVVVDHWVYPKNQLNSIRQVFSVIDDYIRQGWKPEVVFFDWWGKMRTRLMMSNRSKSDADMRMLQANWISDIKGYLEEYGIRGYIFHQKSGAAAGRSASYVGSSHDAQEDRSFNNMLDFCFVSSRKDQDGTVKMLLDVARAADNPLLTLQLDGQRCMITGSTPDYGVSLADAEYADELWEDAETSAIQDEVL